MNYISDAGVKVESRQDSNVIVRMSISAALAVLLFIIISCSQSIRVHAEETYDIEVNVNTNTVTVYQDGQAVRGMICSVGANGATPDCGTFYLGEKMRWHHLYGGVAGQYVTRITGHILFHSVPYTEYGNPASLEEGEFDKLGTSASMGCVRLAVADAKWIFDNCDSNSTVTFYSSEDPGVFGYPVAYQTNAASEELRGWDPTDPEEGNPWLTTEEKYVVEPEVPDTTETADVEENSDDAADAADENITTLSEVKFDINSAAINEIDSTVTVSEQESVTNLPLGDDVAATENNSDKKDEEKIDMLDVSTKEEDVYILNNILGDITEKKAILQFPLTE